MAEANASPNRQPQRPEELLIRPIFPNGRLDSQVSLDAAPYTPVTQAVITCTSDLQHQQNRSGTNIFPHSTSSPVICQKCKKHEYYDNNDSIHPVSTSRSCSDLPTDQFNDSDVEDDPLCMPPNLKNDYYDIMILYAEDDGKEALEFQSKLKEIVLPDESPVLVVLYDDPELSGLTGLRLDNLEKAFKHCEYTFVFLTKKFYKNVWCKLSSESCLMRSLNNEKKRWRVVPVLTSHDVKCPMGLNALKGLRYYGNDETYKKVVTKLVEDTLRERKRKQCDKENKRKSWLKIRGELPQDTEKNTEEFDIIYERHKTLGSEQEQNLEEDNFSPSSDDCDSKEQSVKTEQPKAWCIEPGEDGKGCTDDQDFAVYKTTTASGEQPNEGDKDCKLNSTSVIRPSVTGANTTSSTHSCVSSSSLEVDVNLSIQYKINLTQESVNQTSTDTTDDHSKPPTSSIIKKETTFAFQYYQLGGFLFPPKRNLKVFRPFSKKTMETVTSFDETSGYDLD